MNPKYVEALTEIQHLVVRAVLEDQDAFAENTFVEITEKINAAMDGTPSMKPIVPAHVIPHDEPAAELPRQHGAKIANGVRLFRFRGGDVVKLVGRNQAEDLKQRHVYEIEVKQAGFDPKEFVADCFIDGANVLQLFCTSRSRLEKIAVRAFRYYLWTNKKPGQRRAIKRRAQEKERA